MNTKYMSMIYDSILKCEVENGRLQFTYNEKWCGGVVVWWWGGRREVWRKRSESRASVARENGV